MKTVITKVTVQLSTTGKAIVFTDYKFSHSGRKNEYQGFSVFNTKDEAVKAAGKAVNTFNNEFYSEAQGYFVNDFSSGVKQTSFRSVK
jgi:hypothetical protein